MDAISIIIQLSFFFWGYINPKKAGWAMLFLFPLLYPANFVIIPADILLLNIDRVAFAVAIGIHLRYKEKIKIKYLFKDSFIVTFILFSLFIVLVSLDDRLINILFSYLPNIYLSLILGFTLIKSQKDIERLLKIFMSHAALFSTFIILESFTDLNINILARELNPNFYELNYKLDLRSGYFRASGFDGNAVQTAYRLSFLFPLVLWFTTNSRKNLLKILPISLVLISFILLQSRAGFIGLFIAIIFLLLQLAKTKSVNIIRTFKLLLIFIIAGLIVLFFIPTVGQIFFSFLDYLQSGQSYQQVEMKTDRIPQAISYFFQNPFAGYGSPQFVYYKVMMTDDIPSPLIYLLSGGILLLLLFLLWVILMPLNMLQISKKKIINSRESEMFVFIAAAFIGGLIPLFSNWQERHIPAMLILFSASLKYFYVRKSLSQGDN